MGFADGTDANCAAGAISRADIKSATEQDSDLAHLQQAYGTSEMSSLVPVDGWSNVSDGREFCQAMYDSAGQGDRETLAELDMALVMVPFHEKSLRLLTPVLGRLRSEDISVSMRFLALTRSLMIL